MHRLRFTSPLLEAARLQRIKTTSKKLGMVVARAAARCGRLMLLLTGAHEVHKC